MRLKKVILFTGSLSSLLVFGPVCSNTYATVAVPIKAGIWDYKGADPSIYVDSTKAWTFPSKNK